MIFGYFNLGAFFHHTPVTENMAMTEPRKETNVSWGPKRISVRLQLTGAEWLHASACRAA